MSYCSSEVINWIGLLEAACRFQLDDLAISVGDYLINQQKEWIERNVLAIHKCASSSRLLYKLLDFCNQRMLSTPEVIFKSDDYLNLPKETLITLLKHDELNMKEIDIWTSVIEWATKQVPGLINDPDSWSSDDVITLRAITSDLIPHIRFFNISLEEFNKKIVPYDELLTKKLRHDILHYHIEKDYKPNFPMLPHRKGQVQVNDIPKREYETSAIKLKPDIDSVVINEQQAAWISQKIMELRNDSTCKLTLLYRHSRDGSVEKFQQQCSNKNPTVIVGKVLDSDEILGGYNPTYWTTSSNTDSIWVSTTESFIFSLDTENLERSLVSFVTGHNKAIYRGTYPCFGGGYDLDFGFKSNFGYADKKSYGFAIRSISGNK